jgi:two-component system, response regulator PdtaR
MRKTNILMVEDEPMICEMICQILGENGFDVHAVADGESALRYLENGPQVDVLFTDINLEGRMDGAVLAQHVRERRPELPIVYCSGRYSVSAITPLMSRSLFLKKPYNPSDLCTLLTRLTATEH